MSPSFLSARIFISDSAARGLAFCARVDAARLDQEPAPQAVDVMADTIIREWLDRQPPLAARQKAVRDAIARTDAEQLAALRATV